MNHADYKTLQKSYVDSRMEAWGYITRNWGCTTWAKIPQPIADAAGLPHNVGMCGGNLITKEAADGMNRFVQWMNRPRGIQ